jgi:hypothetical protein
MSGLVAYNSSSDDEGPPQNISGTVPAPVAAASSKPGTQPDIGLSRDDQPKVRNEESTPSISMAPIGPMMPTDEDREEQGQYMDQLPDDLSEKDLVRHLTRTSQAMPSIPPSPPGSPNPATEARFKKFLELKAAGLHFNQDLAKKSSFRNPALLSTLAERAGLDQMDQYSTTLPTSIWSPNDMPSWAYKDELAKSQQAVRDQQAVRKKQASAAGKRSIDFVSANGSGRNSQSSTPGSQR